MYAILSYYVRHVARREQQRPFVAREGGELVLEGMMLAAVAAHEVRGAAADAPAARAGAGRVDQRRVVGQAEVVVAAEADQFASVDPRQA